MLDERAWLERMPCVPTPFDHDKSTIDEMVAYPVAAVGFYLQLSFGFAIPFPLDIIFLPLTVVEWVLRWQISAADM